MSAKVPLASVSELSDWLGEPIDSGSSDERRAGLVLEYASMLVREETGKDWVVELAESKLPEKVRLVTIQAASRGYANPESWGSESVDDWRAGGRPIEELGLYLTATEKAALRGYRPKVTKGLGIIRLSRDQVGTHDGYVPTPDGPPIGWY